MSTTRSIVFGCLNIRSLINKFGDVTGLFRDRHIDLLCLTESSCDSGSVVLGRLRNAGYNAVDRLTTNSSKTEVTWCATSRRQHILPASVLSVDGVMVDPMTSERQNVPLQPSIPPCTTPYNSPLVS